MRSSRTVSAALGLAVSLSVNAAPAPQPDASSGQPSAAFLEFLAESEQRQGAWLDPLSFQGDGWGPGIDDVEQEDEAN